MLIDGNLFPTTGLTPPAVWATISMKTGTANRYEDEMFATQYFQKGTAHISFTRPELVEKMNDIIVRHYPGTLASRS